MTLFVVLGEQGQYSDRLVWISGVFDDREEAERAIAAAMEKRRAFEHWHEEFMRCLRKVKTDFMSITSEKQRIEAEQRAGPKPEFEQAEMVSLFEVPSGKWIGDILEGVEYGYNSPPKIEERA